LSTENRARELKRYLRLLPHRYPFLLVDRVLELGDGIVRTLKNVSIDEPFFVGHFPENPVMPGVLIVEALAQSAALLALGETTAEKRPMLVLTSIDKARFRRLVVPGDQLWMEVRLLKRRRPLWKMRAEARVEQELAVEAELSAMELNREKVP
jgi:3-hydroxyacyl-[acyl-carrier-protein] dehydratase